jgi:ligand-binding SRPBCC domain-containing protein
MTLVTYSSHFDVEPEALFAFHLDVTNLAAISPPVPRLELLSDPQPSQVGDEQVFRLSIGPFSTSWHARITKIEADRLIEDVQTLGPFQRWRHQHRVSADRGGSRLTDVVAFRAIPTPVGEFVEYFVVRPGIYAMFAWRHWKTRAALCVED